jgi:hypothetical protein
MAMVVSAEKSPENIVALVTILCNELLKKEHATASAVYDRMKQVRRLSKSK